MCYCLGAFAVEESVTFYRCKTLQAVPGKHADMVVNASPCLTQRILLQIYLAVLPACSWRGDSGSSE